MGVPAEQIGFYADASVYDILHTPGTAAEVDGLMAMHDRFVRSRRKPFVLEPACGSGRYLRVLGRRGVRCAGYDIDPGMVGYANARLRALGVEGIAEARAGSMTDLAAREGVYTMAFNLINTVRHLDSDAALLTHLRETARALVEGGVYALGVSTSDPALEFPSEDVWSARRGRVGVVQTVQYEPALPGTRDERVYSHLAVTTPTGTTHRDSVYTLRTYTRGQWLSLIEDSAMRLDRVVNEVGEDVDLPVCGYAVSILRPA